MGQLSFNPETLILLGFIVLVGYSSYTLVSGNLNDIGDSAVEDRDSAVECSELDIDFIDVDKDEESVNVIFRSNVDLSAVIVGFKGANTTGLVEDVEANEINNANVNVSNYSNIYIETDKCPNAYWWQ